jgi:8-oxo-dGTP diphosphatase
MIDKNSEQAYLASYNIHDFNVPLATVDMAIFSIINNQLSVLLVKRLEHPFKGQWALPGGFIQLEKDKNIDETAQRKLIEKTGIQISHLEQVGTVGNKKRDPRGWSLTVLYFALIDFLAIKKKSIGVEESKWIPANEANLLKLSFDHNELLRLAIHRLRSKTRYTALPVSLMPSLFTLTELQTIFEVILGVSLQKKAFRKRLLDAGVVIGTESSKISGKRPAQLFQASTLPFDFEFPRALEITEPPNPLRST